MIREKKYFYFSLLLHGILFAFLIFGFLTTSTMPVLENTDKNDAISAIVLGDTEKSHILPHPQIKPISHEEKKVEPPKPIKTLATKSEVSKPHSKPMEKTTQEISKKIPLEIIHKKPKPTIKKNIPKPETDLAKEFLKDMKSIDKKKNKLVQDKSVQKFKDALKQQTELTMREQFKENIKLDAESSKRARGEVNKYQALILQAISANWLIPESVDKNKSAQLLIRLAPNGVVLAVEVNQSSGDIALDRSARAAVFKSSPLPVPEDQAAFASFKEFYLKVSPKDLDHA